MSDTERLSAELSEIIEGLRPFVNGAKITTNRNTVLIHGDLIICHPSIPLLPRYLKVTGNCHLENAELQNGDLPDFLTAGGSVHLNGNPNLSELPKSLHAEDYVNLFDTGITTFPNDFIFCQNGSSISLPHGSRLFTAEQARAEMHIQQNFHAPTNAL